MPAALADRRNRHQSAHPRRGAAHCSRRCPPARAARPQQQHARFKGGCRDRRRRLVLAPVKHLGPRKNRGSASDDEQQTECTKMPCEMLSGHFFDCPLMRLTSEPHATPAKITPAPLSASMRIASNGMPKPSCATLPVSIANIPAVTTATMRIAALPMAAD
jgi:hypothetical protein